MLLLLDPWQQALYFLILSIVRYVLFAGIAFLVFYVILKNKPVFQKIQQRFPANKDFKREIAYSLITFLIFSMVPLILRHPFVKPHSKIYSDINAYGMLYFVLVFPLMIVVHDTYFYFTHRMMHHPRLFKFFHVIHHKSVNPSPWAAFAFNPSEALIESGIIYIFVFTFPVHLVHIFVFLVFMSLYNVYGHLGFEIYPKGLNKHWLGRWINTSVNHNMHHQFFKGNYGLYFTFWDRVLNTLDKDYEEHFERVTTANQQLREKANA